MLRRCSPFGLHSQPPKISAPHNSQIYHRSTRESGAEDFKIFSPWALPRIPRGRSADSWSHIDPCTTKPYREDSPISPHGDYRPDNILDGAPPRAGSSRSECTPTRFGDSVWIDHLLLSRAIGLDLVFREFTSLLADVESRRIQLACLPCLLHLVEEVLFDLAYPNRTLNPRLKRMGGAEKANSLSWDLRLLRELVVGTSSSSLLMG